MIWYTGLVVLVYAIVSTALLTVGRVTRIPPPLTIHEMSVLNPVVKAGETVEYAVRYDKRVECFPPFGDGEVTYKIGPTVEKIDLRGSVVTDVVKGVRRAAWSPGRDRRGAGAALVPADTPAGDYTIIATATYRCSDVAGDVSVTAPEINVRVTN